MKTNVNPHINHLTTLSSLFPTTRLAEAESQLEGQLSKVSSLEKQKARLNGELEDLTIEVERSRAIADSAEKQQRSFDKTIDEWKHKVCL